MTDELEGKTRLGASFQLFALRTACAAFVWAAFMVVSGRPAGSTAASLFDVLVAAPAVVVGAALFWVMLAWLGNLGVPFTGLIALPVMLIVIVGDPLLFVLHIATRSKWPELIPVERLSLINLAAFIVAVELPNRDHD